LQTAPPDLELPTTASEDRDRKFLQRMQTIISKNTIFDYYAGAATLSMK
jgi:hypothetical protein